MLEPADSLIKRTNLTFKEIGERLSVTERHVYRLSKGQTELSSLQRKELMNIATMTNIKPEPVGGYKFDYIDLFAGIGGFRTAFDSINGKCVFTSEWDKFSVTTYTQNYNCNHPVAGDIKEYTKSKETLKQIPSHNFLVGGFPCQPFSLAGVSKKNSLGKQHGFEDKTQGTLFFDIKRILEEHQPEAFLLENVKNLKSHKSSDGIKTYDVIIETLEELGYAVTDRVIDGQNWVPQHRERIFIAGFKKDLNMGFDIKKMQIPKDSPRLESILHSPGDEDEFPYFVNGEVNEKYTLSNKLWSYLKDYKAKHEAKGNGFGYGLFGPSDVARTLSARYHKDGAEILIKQGNNRPRRLTPRECARLMGFDNPKESNFRIPVSDTQAYRQFGNSVIVPLVKAIAREMEPYILKAIKKNKKQIELFESKSA